MSVPNTTTFTFQDVTTEVYSDINVGRNLVSAFVDATGTFDPSYVGSKNQLLNFRNYCQLSIYLIAAGNGYSIFYGNNLTWGWGYNTYGQVGDNSIINKQVPVSILGTKKTFLNIVAGQYTTIGLDKNGQVWGWGYNYFTGQLGDNSTINKCTPVSIHGVKKTFCKIDTWSHTMGIDNRGQVWGWGANYQCQLGNNSQIRECTPVSIHGTKKTFCKISTGQYHTIGIDKNSQIWGWGYNTFGELGDNTQTQQCTPVSIQGTKKTFCTISTNTYFTMGIDNRGQVWGWGYNNNGQLGVNSIINKCTPVSIQGTKKTFCNISSGYNFTMGIDNGGQVWGWGYNFNGQLGNNSQIIEFTPVSIHGTKKTFCEISGGDRFSLGVDNIGQVWSWGANDAGQLGIMLNKCTPVSISGVKKTFCEISGGDKFSIGVDKNGQVWGWGYNSFGQLGNNSTIVKYSPVSILGAKKTFCEIVAGSIGIDNHGQVWGWGYNSYGQLGDNSVGIHCTPVSIHGIKKTFCKISFGQNFSIGIDKNEQVWCWGYNRKGQLGDNTSTEQHTPVSIHGVKKTFCKICAGLNFMLGIDNIGQVWGWGYNNYGQLGNNSTIDQCTPVSIQGTKKTFCEIRPKALSTIGIDNYGQVWSWGRGIYGQLGNNSTIDQCTPVSIQGAKKTFCRIGSFGESTIGIDNHGQIWGWGYNNYGQLGNNSIINQCTPVSIHGAKKTFCKISQGWNHDIVIDNHGQVWGWGYNYHGELGNNITTYTPLKVSFI